MRAIKKRIKLQNGISQINNKCLNPMLKLTLKTQTDNIHSKQKNRQQQVNLQSKDTRKPSPYYGLLRDSLMSALGVSSLVGCWQVEPPPCNSPTPILNMQDRESGYSVCSEGQTIRTGDARCNQVVELPDGEARSPYDYYDHTQACASDSDCDGQQQCFCNSYGVGQCVSSNCQECGGRCEVRTIVSSDETCGYDEYGNPSQYNLICLKSDQNECYTDEDCGYGASCIIKKSDEKVQYLACQINGLESTGFGAICGRPLCESQTILEADICEGSAWSDASPYILSKIEQEIKRILEQNSNLNQESAVLIKAQLLKHWRSIAQLEHSSVASFSRLTLELMALSAPADLLLETQQAAADEVKHAQSALEIVSALHQKPMQFAQFPSGSISIRTDRDTIMRSCVQEACLGETLGVIEAENELDLIRQADGPKVLTNRLSTVLTDESKHAALAWRTLKWLLESDAPCPQERARRLDLITETMYSTAQQLLKPETSQSSMTHHSLGLLTDLDRALFRAQGFQEVVLPVLVEFLGQTRSQNLKALAWHSLRHLNAQLSA